MLLRHGALYLAARGLPGIVNLAAVAVYTRLLLPEEYGRYALVLAAVGLTNKLLFEWLRLALLRFRPAFSDRWQVLGATLWLGFLAIVGLTAVLGGVALLAGGTALPRGLLAVGLVLLWMQALFDLHLELVRSRLAPVRYGLMALARAVLALAFGVGLVTLGLGAAGVLAGLALGMLVPTALPTWRELRGLRLGQGDPMLLRELAVYGAPLAVTAGLGFLVYSADRFMIGWFLGEEALGRYAASYDLASNAMGILLMVVNLAAYPLVVRALEQDGIEAARRYMTQNATALLGIGLPAAVGFALLAPGIADVLLGPGFRRDAAALMPIIIVGTFLRDFKAYYLDVAFQLGRRTLGQLWISLGVAALNIALNLWAIPRFGILGAAYASVASYLLGIVLSGLLGRRVFPLPWPRADGAKIVLATAAMGAVVWLAGDWHGPARLLGGTLLGVVAYAASVWLLDVAGARSLLHQAWTRRWRARPS